jgi:hypothetical protein
VDMVTFDEETVKRVLLALLPVDEQEIPVDATGELFYLSCDVADALAHAYCVAPAMHACPPGSDVTAAAITSGSGRLLQENALYSSTAQQCSYKVVSCVSASDCVDEQPECAASCLEAFQQCLQSSCYDMLAPIADEPSGSATTGEDDSSLASSGMPCVMALPFALAAIAASILSTVG